MRSQVMCFDKSKNEEHAGISPLVQKYCFLENWHIFSDIFLRLYSMKTSGADTYAMVTAKSFVVPLEEQYKKTQKKIYKNKDCI